MLELSSNRTYLTIADQDTSRRVLYSTLVDQISIYTANSSAEWEYPKMITDTWQWIKLDINLDFDDESLANALKINVHRIELLLFSRSLSDKFVEPFQEFKVKLASTRLSKCETKIHFLCKFQILTGSTTMSLKKVFLIGLKIGQFTITYLTTDILVGSNQNQIRQPYKFGDKLKKELRTNTYWFREAEDDKPKPTKAKKREKSDTDEMDGKSRVTKKHVPLDPSDNLLTELFPELFQTSNLLCPSFMDLDLDL